MLDGCIPWSGDFRTHIGGFSGVGRYPPCLCIGHWSNWAISGFTLIKLFIIFKLMIVFLLYWWSIHKEVFCLLTGFRILYGWVWPSDLGARIVVYLVYSKRFPHYNFLSWSCMVGLLFVWHDWSCGSVDMAIWLTLFFLFINLFMVEVVLVDCGQILIWWLFTHSFGGVGRCFPCLCLIVDPFLGLIFELSLLSGAFRASGRGGEFFR